MQSLVRARITALKSRSKVPLTLLRHLSSTEHLSRKKNFVKERKDYEEQVSQLRKVYREEFLKKQAEEEAKKKQERARVLAEKRVRKAKRATRANRSLARVEDEREQQNQKLRLYQQEMDIVRAERSAKAKLAVESMVTQVCHEASTWIDRNNIDDKITEELFARRGSTGLFAPSTYYMRYAADVNWGGGESYQDQNGDDILEKLMGHFDKEAAVRNQFARELVQDFTGTAQDITNEEQYVAELSEVLKGVELVVEDKHGNKNKFGGRDDKSDRSSKTK
mmetsp:Transcript_31696/g.49635  ORF Transcript_31696/g.49635 Transcript_31696/m.49635 type:complete len:279 (-) Transcript_31696:261-1097(-)|eukprot:CAMPEP_0194561890 /NCGR_PEP_ID=MMETSP0292-20121207/2508_1 /TAXON_ID=39354 /ORGANISM="Heterosigma akashiwo, Strain CCMP2393" /LENGTH=278 /DNA_ID=CAMNT_0039410397 /DNA_START=23 /DNA_END=859 /DNA_ORIENTATION=-